MEKQPVDDFFARKLRDAEVPVKSDVFSELQKRMGTKPLPVRRSVAGWWSVASAACVLIALWFLNRADTEQLPQPGIAPIAHNQKSVPAEPIAPNQKDQLANVPELEKPVNRQEGKDVTYKNQLSQVKTHNLKLTKLRTQSPAGDQPKASSLQSAERVIVMRPQQSQQTSISPSVPLSTPVELVGERKKPSAERTIILTIDEPQIATALAANRIDLRTPSELPAHQNGLSGLVGKLRQLKNGEALAKVTPSATQSSQKNRFGRVFEEVKESLKNETTLE